MADKTLTMTVYKYWVPPGFSILRMHRGARILCAGADPQGAVAVWALVNAREESVDRRFLVIQTGTPANDAERGTYCGMAVVNEYVIWHVFDLGEV